MDERILEMLIRLGLIEAYQSYLENNTEFNSYYYEEDEVQDDEFFREDLDEEE